MKDLRQKVSDYLSQATDSTKNLIERVQGYMVYARENPKKAREEITDIVREDFLKAYEKGKAFVVPYIEPLACIVVVGLAGYGTIKSISGLYTIVKTSTNEGLTEIVLGSSMLAFAGIGAAVLGRLFHPYNGNYQPQR